MSFLGNIFKGIGRAFTVPERFRRVFDASPAVQIALPAFQASLYEAWQLESAKHFGAGSLLAQAANEFGAAAIAGMSPKKSVVVLNPKVAAKAPESVSDAPKPVVGPAGQPAPLPTVVSQVQQSVATPSAPVSPVPPAPSPVDTQALVREALTVASPGIQAAVEQAITEVLAK